MAETLSWLGGGFIVAGALLSILGAVGVLRFPDVYTRIHAASLTDTGGASLMLLGMGFMSPFGLVTLKLLLVWGFVMLTSPAAANALANAAFGAGLRPRIGTFQIMGEGGAENKPTRSGDGASS